ncbi:MAG: hypothetical protein GXP38_11750 [Chloroflexi bacterium]|nr:hypothetical protein [Chloroflexota bacterium]
MHSLSEITGDFVVYRNLEPFHADVPGIGEAWQEMGLDSPQIVRKRDPQYPQVVTWLLQRFHQIHAPHAPLTELILIGDTLSNDGGAYRRLAEFTGWQGGAFIGREELTAEAVGEWQGGIFVASRWQLVADWLGALLEQGLALDERTIVIVDVDKTALGARGRNHRVIDETRLEAMRATVTRALGEKVDISSFTEIYHELNQAAYHDLTGDNQDYLAYISVMSGAGVVPITTLRRRHEEGKLNSFKQFIALIEAQTEQLSPALHELHQAVFTAYQKHDPTPFKEFRRNEYLRTVAHMGSLPEDATQEQRQAQEICLTQEVWDACQWLKLRGALIMALSDKPDEACAPSEELAAQGFVPIHHTPTHLLGEHLSL